MSEKGKGSDAGSGVLKQLGHDGVTTAVAAGSVMAMAIPVVGPFVAIGGVLFIGYRSVRRGLRRGR